MHHFNDIILQVLRQNTHITYFIPLYLECCFYMRAQKSRRIIWCSSVTQSCPTLCSPMDCSTPGLPVHHQHPELAQTHVHRVRDAIQPFHPVAPFSSCPQSFPASGSFPINQLFPSGGQSIRVSASTSVFPMNVQD